jgi:hypothetical protein
MGKPFPVGEFHEVGKPGPAAACQKQPLRQQKQFYSFQRFLVTRPILENSSLFNYCLILLFSEEQKKISRLG